MKHIDESAYVRIAKNDFGILIVLVDITIMVLYVVFINRLESLQKAYAEQYEDETIAMTDFCFQFTNMPQNAYFDGSESVLRLKLWSHLNKVIVDQLKYEASQGYGEREQDLENLSGGCIADITFAKSDSGESNILYKT